MTMTMHKSTPAYYSRSPLQKDDEKRIAASSDMHTGPSSSLLQQCVSKIVEDNHIAGANYTQRKENAHVILWLHATNFYNTEYRDEELEIYLRRQLEQESAHNSLARKEIAEADEARVPLLPGQSTPRSHVKRTITSQLLTPSPEKTITSSTGSGVKHPRPTERSADSQKRQKYDGPMLPHQTRQMEPPLTRAYIGSSRRDILKPNGDCQPQYTERPPTESWQEKPSRDPTEGNLVNATVTNRSISKGQIKLDHRKGGEWWIENATPSL